MMMEGAGLRGDGPRHRRVVPTLLLAAVKDSRRQLIGMSALLTTTMPSRWGTRSTLKAAGLRDKVKVMVGGAPVARRLRIKSTPTVTRRMPLSSQPGPEVGGCGLIPRMKGDPYVRTNYVANAGVRFNVFSQDQLEELFNGVFHLLQYTGLDVCTMTTGES